MGRENALIKQYLHLVTVEVSLLNDKAIFPPLPRQSTDHVRLSGRIRKRRMVSENT